MRRGLLHFSVASLALLSACGFLPQDEAAGPMAGVSRAPDPVVSGAAQGPGTSSGDASIGSSTGPDAPPQNSEPTPAATATLAQGLAVSEVALFQGVKVSLAKNGANVTTRTMPAVAGRDGLVRVYVTPDASWTARTVTAELHLVSGPEGLPILRDTKTISVPSSDDTVASTFNFDVPGASLPAGVEYFVQLLDAATAPVDTATENVAQYPRLGTTESVGVVTGAASLKIVVVPFRYGADGSNRVPDTSPAALDPSRKRALELYPVPSVDITVHAAVDWPSAIAPDGTGWAEVLAELTQLRMTEKPTGDTYYYGVFAPAATAPTYCPQSCVLGLSNYGGSATDATQRASVGVLYAGGAITGTLAHEIGHAHGRLHSPCGGAAGPDPKFPYADATIGTWGYSIVSKQLKNPNATTMPHDFMSYCDPAWTSDYTFKALFDRGRTLQVTNMSRVSSTQVHRALRTLLVAEDGTLRWSTRAPVWTDAPLEGEARQVTFVGAGGVVLGTAIAHRYGYDHLTGSSLLVPEGPPGTVRVVVAGTGDIAAK